MAINIKRNLDSIVIKGIIVAILTLLMLIPISMTSSLIDERATHNETVKEEISSKWGGEQEIVGPILILPYEKQTYSQTKLTKAGEEVVFEKKVDYAYFLPQTYNVKSNLQTEQRYRSIYNALVYQTESNISGHFEEPNIASLNIKKEDVKWDEAFLVIGIPNMQGITNKVVLDINGIQYEANPGVPSNAIVNSGLTIKMPIDPANIKETYDFNFNLNLNGCEKLFVSPIGKENNIKMQSEWKTVSLVGDFLATNREINDKGFSAEWNVFDYNRNYVQMWTGANDQKTPMVGVDLKFPVDQYQMSTRSVKYAIMFIVLTFVIFFFVEIITKRKIHYVQYILVSFALIIFYTLLIALSEHINFHIAYLVSAVAIVIMITLYSKTIFKKTLPSLAMGGFVVAIYTYLYVILQLEDMALLIGAIGLFVALAAIMYASRKVEWYKEEEDTEEQTGLINNNRSSESTIQI